MTSNRALRPLVILFALTVLSGMVFLDAGTPPAAPALSAAPTPVTPLDGDASTKARPQRTQVPTVPDSKCGACYLDEWNNKKRECCVGSTCKVESCPIEIDNVLK